MEPAVNAGLVLEFDPAAGVLRELRARQGHRGIAGDEQPEPRALLDGAVGECEC